jgi:transposase, IS5 family
VQALPGNPYDGHTLAEVIPAIEQLVGNTIERLHADAGYRGHNAPADYKFNVQAEAPRHPADQTRDATPLCRRAGHRPSQGPAPNGPQLSRPPPWRLQQRRPRRRWLQLPPPHQVAQDLIAPLHGDLVPDLKTNPCMKRRFFTDDSLVVGIGLMALLFYSNRRGYDEPPKYK